MKDLILKSTLAGVLIALAGAIFLNCQNKVVGAGLFSIGLLAVLVLEADLFTGKVGYINSKQTFLQGLCILGINLVSAFLVGLIYRYCVGVTTAMETRLAKEWYRILLDGIGCGALIYLAVELYKKTRSPIPVILCVMGFILAGFEHCIADVFYFGTGDLTWKGLGYLGLVIAGNSIGSVGVRLLQVGVTRKHELRKDI